MNTGSWPPSCMLSVFSFILFYVCSVKIGGEAWAETTLGFIETYVKNPEPPCNKGVHQSSKFATPCFGEKIPYVTLSLDITNKSVPLPSSPASESVGIHCSESPRISKGKRASLIASPHLTSLDFSFLFPPSTPQTSSIHLHPSTNASRSSQSNKVILH